MSAEDAKYVLLALIQRFGEYIKQNQVPGKRLQFRITTEENLPTFQQFK